MGHKVNLSRSQARFVSIFVSGPKNYFKSKNCFQHDRCITYNWEKTTVDFVDRRQSHRSEFLTGWFCWKLQSNSPRAIVEKNWSILAKNRPTRTLYDAKIIYGKRRPHNLRDHLVTAKVKPVTRNLSVNQNWEKTTVDFVDRRQSHRSEFLTGCFCWKLQSEFINGKWTCLLFWGSRSGARKYLLILELNVKVKCYRLYNFS